jgi:Na+/proline symporter
MNALDWTIIAVYLGAMVAVGLASSRRAGKGIEAYFLGERSLPWWTLGASGMASNLDIAGTMINTALIFSLGLTGILIEIRGGVGLLMALLMAFMGKWTRRARVMTMAEWMCLRFGDGAQGALARLITAVAHMIMTVGAVTYFCTGTGKFIHQLVPFPALLGLPPTFWASVGVVALASVYTVATGLYGVIWTDVAQSLLILLTIVIVCGLAIGQGALPESFSVAVPLSDGGFQAVETTRQAWGTIWPRWRLDITPGSTFAAFNLFGPALLFFLFKVILEGGGGGVNGYLAQRYLAVETDREAGLLSGLWIVLLSFRWPFSVAVAMLAIGYCQRTGTVIDPELALPLVLAQLIPSGVKGLLLAGSIAAAMSTFDSTVNAGAAYWVRDIYQAFLRPGATERQLMTQSRLGSVILVLVGLAFTLGVENINQIWRWLTMSLWAGLLVPMVLRWYWWRLNGHGFSAGVLAGIGASLIQMTLFADWPEYTSFCFVSVSSLVATLFVTLVTEPTDLAVVEAFYRRIRPAGLWGPVRDSLEPGVAAHARRQNRRDIAVSAITIPWQLCLFCLWMTLMARSWTQSALLFCACAVLTAVLHRHWYRHLDTGGLES